MESFQKKNVKCSKVRVFDTNHIKRQLNGQTEPGKDLY